MNALAAANTQYATESIMQSTQTQTTSTSFSEELQKATATQTSATSKTSEEIIAEYRAMPNGNGNGIFDLDAIKAAYIKKHEEEFKRDYPLYEKYKDIFIPKYSNYTRQKADNICRDMNAQFPEYKSLHDKACDGGTQEDMDKFNEYRLDYQAYSRYLHDKYDLDLHTGMNYNSIWMDYGTEGTRAFNYAVYEQLEKGVSMDEATQMATSVAIEFGGREANDFKMMMLMDYPDSMEEAMSTNEYDKKIHYDQQIDLRDQGINHNFVYTNYEVIFGTDKDGIKRRLSYELDLYKFLTENEDLVDQKLSELKERSPEWFDSEDKDGNYANNLKEKSRNSYKVAQFAKDIFDKYGDKIFENGDSHSFQELAQKAEITKNKITNSQEYEIIGRTEKSALEVLIQKSK